jgi:hypothetical protein
MSRIGAELDSGVRSSDPEPQPWRSVELREAVASALRSTFNPNPDDPEPTGPGGPVIREILAAIGVLRMSALIADPVARQSIERVASGIVAASAGRAAEISAQIDRQAPILDPEPSPWRNRDLQQAVSSALASSANPNPDDPEPIGPGAPVIREILAAVGVLRMSALIEDPAARQSTRQIAARVLSVSAEGLAEHA